MANQPITNEQLDDWEELDKAATPGPWRYSTMPTLGTLTAKDNYGERHSLITNDAPFTKPADAEIAAFARTAFPLLITEVRRLREEMVASRTPLGAFWKDMSDPDNPVVKRWNGESWDVADAETDDDGNVLVWNAGGDD